MIEMQNLKATDETKEFIVHQVLKTRSLVLIGLMGAGKSAIGRRVAAFLDMPFMDADHEIEVAAGQSIADIFADHGEAFFRSGEERVIERLLNAGPMVLATGGGAFMSQVTQNNIKAHGVSLWLSADLDILMERVSRRDHRPLLRTEDPRGVMQKLMDERYPVYSLADITVMSRNEPHEVIVDEILEALIAFHQSNVAPG